MVSPQPRSRLTSDDGLTLIEMVVSIGVLMIVLAASLAVFVTVESSQQTAEGTDRATQLANSRIERLRQLDFKSVGFFSTTYAAKIASTDYATYIPTGETSVLFTTGTETTVEADKILPYEETTAAEARNKYTVYTTITWGKDAALGLPTTSATTPAGGYSFKRVRVTVVWKSNGDGATHKVTNEAWFAPQGYEEAPPGIAVTTE